MLARRILALFLCFLFIIGIIYAGKPLKTFIVSPNDLGGSFASSGNSMYNQISPNSRTWHFNRWIVPRDCEKICVVLRSNEISAQLLQSLLRDYGFERKARAKWESEADRQICWKESIWFGFRKTFGLASLTFFRLSTNRQLKPSQKGIIRLLDPWKLGFPWLFDPKTPGPL